MGTLKQKSINMNNDARDGTTDRPVYLNNEVTPDATVFSGAAPASTAFAGTGAASGGGLFIVSGRRRQGF